MHGRWPVCECGHGPEEHVYLPGHPDGAQECYGSAECECGKFRPMQEA
jgi:hypothetical protein